MARPASTGPAMKPTVNDRVVSAFAAGSSSGSSSLGTIAERAGLFTAKKADCAATTR